MLDKRCHCKVRETQAFYLFIKHKKIYYAYFPNLKLTRSTGMSDVRNILDGLEKTDKITYRPYDNPKRQRDLNRVLSYINQSRPLTRSSIESVQKKMLSEGLSGKSINNYIYVLRKACTGVFPSFTPLEHTAVYRSCFPVPSFYHIYPKCTDRLHFL